MESPESCYCDIKGGANEFAKKMEGWDLRVESCRTGYRERVPDKLRLLEAEY